MTDDWNLRHEVIRTFLSCASGGIILGLTWFVGQGLTYRWTVRQKRREFQMSALQQFHSAYGEFFAVWKLWNRLGEAERVERRWSLHQRAAAAEAVLEGTIVKLSSEVKLAHDQVCDLGRFRQAFQQLRESIREDRRLEWLSSDAPEYRTFKVLAVRISALLGGEWPYRPISCEDAAEQLLKITSNEWSGQWILFPANAANTSPETRSRGTRAG